jgi:hypothetical protein
VTTTLPKPEEPISKLPLFTYIGEEQEAEKPAEDEKK